MLEEYTSKDMDHLGMVAVICNEIGLVETIDTLIPPDPRAEITLGETVKLMVINGLGFTSKPLYLEAHFYNSKPIERLLGRQIAAESITDDRLGRALERCYEFGCDQIFAVLSSKAVSKYKVSQKCRHLDTTSMSVYGNYLQEDDLDLVTFGHSKDHRADLKQFMISLMCSEDGDVPLLAQTIAGNSSDKTHFLETVKSLKKQIQEGDTASYYLVADSALYTASTLQEMSGTFKWITRVPEKITEAKRLVLDTSKEEMTHLYDGYFFKEVRVTYANVPQRWLIIYSEQAYERENTTLERRIIKEIEEQSKALRRLAFQDFDCECDARSALAIFEKKLKYLAIANIEMHCRNVKTGKGRPKKDAPLTTKYRIQATLAPDQEKIGLHLRTKGKFIVATNELDDKKLLAQEILDTYKGQQAPERGFRFLKDSSFMTPSVFLKNQDRIVALGMIMCLCLLVYTIAQRYLRMQLKKLHSTVPNQKGKPTAVPTMRWIFQLFEGVHLLIHKTAEGITEIMLNLNPIRLHIIDILGEPFREIYKNLI